MFKKFVKDSIIYTIPSLVSKSTSFILIPLYSRILNPSEFGSFDLFLIFLNLINLTISLEITQAVARYYVDEDDDSKKTLIVSTSFWFTLFCYLTFYIFSSIFSNNLSLIIMGNSIKYNNIFKLGLVYIFLNGIFYFIQNQLRWDLKSIEYSILSAINAISAVFFTFVFCNIYKLGFNGIFYALILSSFTSLMYGFIKLKKIFILNFSFNLLMKLLSFSTPLLFSSLSVYISNYIGRLILSKHTSFSELGIFAIAFRVSSIIGLVMTGIQTSLSPLVYSHHKEVDTPETIAKIFRFFVFISMILTSVLIIYSSVIIKIFTTKEYYASDQIIIFLIPSIVFSQMYIFAPGIGIAKKTLYYIYINILGALLSILLNYFLIINFGIKGAAISSLCVYFILFIIFMHFSQKLYYVPHKWDSILKYFILSIIIILLFKYYFIKINILLGLIAPFVILMLAFTVNFFKKTDLTFLNFLNKK